MNREIVDYIVLSDVRIERKVMEYIKKGRQPFGSPFMSGKELEMYTRQAMVKYAPLPDDEFDYLKDYDPTKYDKNNNTPMFDKEHTPLLFDKKGENDI